MKPFAIDPDDISPGAPATVRVLHDVPCTPESQVAMSLAEIKTLQLMPGGVCLINWLRVRGLLDEPTQES